MVTRFQYPISNIQYPMFKGNSRTDAGDGVGPPNSPRSATGGQTGRRGSIFGAGTTPCREEKSQYPISNIQHPIFKGNSQTAAGPSVTGYNKTATGGSAGTPRPTEIRWNPSAWGRANRPGEPRPVAIDWRSGFTLIEVLAAMAVLVVLILALTRMFVSSANITSRGLTAIARNSVGETAMDSILQDLDCMVVNERIACAKIANDVKYLPGDPEGSFDTFYFIGTAGDQDDDMPYEYFKYYVKPVTVTTGFASPRTSNWLPAASYRRR